MTKKFPFQLLLLSIFSLTLTTSCSDDDGINGGGGGGPVAIPDFNFPTTVTFEQNLSSYGIFQGNPLDLLPANDFHLMELSSVLFTDYSQKQRLVKVPEGEQMIRNADGSLSFPDGTILVKTFYYYNDDRDISLGKQMIETRLMIKEDELWNIATYRWNDQQTEATLELGGLETQVNWITTDGVSRSTLYQVPDVNECIACHQSNSSTIPLGTSLRNLNREVSRNSLSLNQIAHFQSLGIVNSFNIGQVGQIIDYNNTNEPLATRARAYLDINCAHCHNPNAWEEPADQDMDLRYETPFNLTGIIQASDDIEEMVLDGEMPFIGTTVLDEEGIQLITAYLNSL